MVTYGPGNGVNRLPVYCGSLQPHITTLSLNLTHLLLSLSSRLIQAIKGLPSDADCLCRPRGCNYAIYPCPCFMISAKTKLKSHNHPCSGSKEEYFKIYIFIDLLPWTRLKFQVRWISRIHVAPNCNSSCLCYSDLMSGQLEIKWWRVHFSIGHFHLQKPSKLSSQTWN